MQVSHLYFWLETCEAAPETSRPAACEGSNSTFSAHCLGDGSEGYDCYDFTANRGNNGICEQHFNCLAYDFDGGDCDLALFTEPEESPCDGVPVLKSKVWGWYGDGVCDENLNCKKWNWDNCDCPPPYVAAGSASLSGSNPTEDESSGIDGASSEPASIPGSSGSGDGALGWPHGWPHGWPEPACFADQDECSEAFAKVDLIQNEDNCELYKKVLNCAMHADCGDELEDVQTTDVFREMLCTPLEVDYQWDAEV